MKSEEIIYLLTWRKRMYQHRKFSTQENYSNVKYTSCSVPPVAKTEKQSKLKIDTKIQCQMYFNIRNLISAIENKITE